MNGLLNHLSLSLKLNFRSKQAIIYGYVVPIFFLLAFGSVFRASKPPLMREMGQLITVTVLGGACFGMPTAMVAERERGVWRRYRLLPAAIGGIILSAMIARFLIVLSAVVLQYGLAWAIYRTPMPEHLWAMALVFTFVCFSFLGLGLVIAMLADNVPAVQALGQAIFLPMIMIGGVGVPLWQLPVWAQHVAGFFPGRYAVEALQACQHGPGLSAGRFDLISLTVIGVAAILAGAKMFRWDVAQKVSDSSKVWVGLAVIAWVIVGLSAEQTGKLKAAVRPVDEGSSLLATLDARTQPAIAPTLVPSSLPSTILAIAIAPPASAPALKAPWEKVTQEQIDSITYDDLPDDNGTVTPLAADLNGLDQEGRKRLDAFNDGLGDWPPGEVADVPQRLRNFLSICAVADIVEDQHEAQVPFVVFNYLKANVQKDQLIKGLTWIILNDTEGTVFTNVKDIKELAIDGEVPEQSVRERLRAYAKKLLFRLLDKKPVPR